MIEAYELCIYLQQYDILCLTETGQEDDQLFHTKFPNYTPFSIHSTTRCRTGSGCTILIKHPISEHATLWRKDDEVSSVWVKISKQYCQLETDLYIACCYIPPVGSSQHTRTPLRDRFQLLHQHIAEAMPLGHVFIAGDFNARIGQLSELPSLHPPHLPTTRAMQDTITNTPAGHSLVKICKDNRLVLLTGRTPGDAGEPTFSSTHTSRPDHTACDYSLYKHVTQQHIPPEPLGSDHSPIHTTLALPSSPPPPRQHNPSPSLITPIPPHLKWNRSAQQEYYDALQRSSAALHSTATDMEADLEASVSSFLAILKECAMEAGHKQVRPKKPTRPAAAGHKHQTWFDAECKAAHAALRQASKNRSAHTADGIKLLDKEYKRLCKRKKIAHAHTAAEEKMQQLKQNPRAAFHQLNPKKPSSNTRTGSPQECVAYFGSILSPSNAPTSQPPGLPMDDADHPLNAPFEEDEVHEALRSLKPGKAAGADGLTSEFLRYAYPPKEPGGTPTSRQNVLAPVLCKIFNHMLVTATVPASWGETLLTLLHKKGDPTAWSNYRPIAVVHLMSKLLAIMIERRLSAWLDDQPGKRRMAQTGFRKGQSTLSNAFIVQHFIDKHRHRKRHVYMACIDLAKAYDSVPRQRIWDRLHALGIRGGILHLIAALYRHTSMSIKFDDGTLPAFDATIGVKQGCPLSPLLFSLFIEELDAHIVTQHPNIGTAFNHPMKQHIPDVLYADDTTLLATTPIHLQKLINTVCTWCTQHDMSLNDTKTEIIVFNSRQCKHSWTVNGHIIHGIPECRLLGMQFHERLSPLHAMRTAASKANKAISALYRKLKDLNIGKKFALVSKLYSIMVEPVLMYGCEVWGSCLFTTKQKHEARDAGSKDCLDVEGIQRNFLRGALRFKRNTPVWVLYRETGMYPTQHLVLERMLKFIKRTFTLGPDEYLRKAMIDNLHDYRVHGIRNWSSSLFTTLQYIGIDTCNITSFDFFDSDQIRDCMSKWRNFYCDKTWSNLPADPRSAPSDDIKICTYHNWFAPPLPAPGQKWSPPSHISSTANIPYHHCIALAKFRTSSHHLLIETLRGKTPRAARICPLCKEGRQDEHHVMFECTALEEVRSRYPGLWASEVESLNALFNTSNSGALASLTHKILDLTKPTE